MIYLRSLSGRCAQGPKQALLVVGVPLQQLCHRWSIVFSNTGLETPHLGCPILSELASCVVFGRNSHKSGDLIE